MKKVIFLLACTVLLAGIADAQTPDAALEKNKAFTGAPATQKQYHAIYQLDVNDPKIIGKAFRNINNALNDPRLAGKIQIELIAFGLGTDAYMKSGPYEADLKALIGKGVIVAQCSNTIRERNIDKSQLYDFLAYVPSGNGELIIRQAEGWSVVKP